MKKIILITTSGVLLLAGWYYVISTLSSTFFNYKNRNWIEYCKTIDCDDLPFGHLTLLLEDKRYYLPLPMSEDDIKIPAFSGLSGVYSKSYYGKDRKNVFWFNKSPDLRPVSSSIFE